MAGKEKYTPDEVIDAIRKATGMVYVAADRLGCCPQTIYNYAKRYRKVAQELDRQSGLMGDRTELKLFKAIADGEPWAITFYLRTKHKARGYVERSELSGPDGGPVAITIIEQIVAPGDGQVDAAAGEVPAE